VVALESGWIVTEVGRQPWIVNNVMRTSDAVTHANGIRVTFVALVLLYTVLGAALIIVLRTMSRRWRSEDGLDEAGPYSPEEAPPPDLAAGAAG
jgi:cytochrome d ubiquinol oxidase subunit I